MGCVFRRYHRRHRRSDGRADSDKITAYAPKDGRLNFLQRALNEADGGYRIWLSTLAGGTPVPLTTGDSYQDGPTWSPDGEWVAYINGSKNAAWSLNKIRVGAASPIVMMTGISPFARPQWSPDGRWILCQTPDGLKLVPPDGGDARTITISFPTASGTETGE